VSAGVLALIALVTAVLLRQGATGEQPAATTAPASDAPVWADVLRWIDTELDAETRVVVTPAVGAGLLSAGGDEARFLPPDGQAPGALLLLSGEPPPSESAVLARFEDPGGAVLTLVDPAPGVPTADELGRRQRLSAAVLANPNTGATGRAADVLGTADVDARLLAVLAVLVAQLGVGVADFPPAPAEPADGPPARHVLLDRLGGEPLTHGSAAAGRIQTFLAAQRPPFAPDTVDVTDDGVLVGFRYESAPDAVITENTP
jgi:hypothetical protein